MMIVSLVSVFYYIRVAKLIYFEPKKITICDERFQTPFEIKSLSENYILISFIMTLLIIAFFNPTSVLLGGQYLILGLIGF